MHEIRYINISEMNTSIPVAWINDGVFLQGKSRIRIEAIPGYTGTEGQWSPWAGFTHCTITIEGKTYTTTPNSTEIEHIPVGAGTLQCKIQAHRSGYVGGTITETRNIAVLAYANPYVSTLTVARCNSAGTEIDDGTYAKIRLAADVSSVGGRNTYLYRVYYKESNASGDFVNYFTVPTPVSTAIDKTWTAGGALSVDKSYIFEARATDVFSTSKRQTNLPTSTNVIDIKGNGKGVAFGKAAETDNLLDSYWPIKAPSIRVGSNADLIYETGSWTPTVYGAGGGTAAHSTQYGRYARIGNLVVLTGRIYLSGKGTMSGEVRIGGLPYTGDTGAGYATGSAAVVGLQSNPGGNYINPLNGFEGGFGADYVTSSNFRLNSFVFVYQLY